MFTLKLIFYLLARSEILVKFYQLSPNEETGFAPLNCTGPNSRKPFSCAFLSHNAEVHTHWQGIHLISVVLIENRLNVRG